MSMRLEDEHSDALSQRVAQAFTPTLSKSNSTASGHYSIRSHVSVRHIGTIPYGELRVHGRSDSDVTERDTIKSITEKTTDPPAPLGCLAKGDILRLLDFPKDFVVGHDTVAMTTSETLKGFRDIPSGVHFLWVQKPEPGPRCGYWYVTKVPGVVRVKQWDLFNEVLGDAASQFEVRVEEASISTVYPSLKPYNLKEEEGVISPKKPSPASLRPEPLFMTDTVHMWRQLTSAISAPFLDRVTGKKGVAEWLVDSMDCVRGESRLPGGIATASETYRTIVGSDLRFLFSQDIQDLRILDQGRNPDTTSRVVALLNSADYPINEADIVAELQFIFITGTHLGNTACLEYWWKLVLRIILRAFQLSVQRPPLCRWLIRTLHAQLVYTDNNVESLQQDSSNASDGPSEDKLLFHSLRQSKSLLHGALVEYKSRINTLLLDLGNRITQEQKEVGYAFEDLEAWLWRCGWDLRKIADGGRRSLLDDDDEEDDDLPVIVDIDENGREVGLVSFHRD
ncbi:AAR2 protein-domain-containing protein [Podospora aff. communis PSN243]|uniref:AAR2 protein-domain-containing protein n=1 Tax=Podospora aff. communis PSN243 TaxID=3040156 RepID=A0AAV9GF45_9PEZI|nr:AAR2 protein-domain-containing protein [Podospora aff. communis PSN243]